MATNVDIIEVTASNTLVPNLTIFVDNENDDDEPSAVEFVDTLETKEDTKTKGDDAKAPSVSFEIKSLPNHSQVSNACFSDFFKLSVK